MRFDTAARLVTARGAMALKLATARTPWQRLRGLIGHAPLALDGDGAEALLLPACTSVHGCFMRQDLDLAYLDDRLHVTETTRLQRYGWSLAGRRGGMRPQHVLELPAGAVRRLSIAAGDRLVVEPTADGRAA
jgi:uncharacterized protein